jgi:hypothetical protein
MVFDALIRSRHEILVLRNCAGAALLHVLHMQCTIFCDGESNGENAVARAVHIGRYRYASAPTPLLPGAAEVSYMLRSSRRPAFIPAPVIKIDARKAGRGD